MNLVDSNEKILYTAGSQEFNKKKLDEYDGLIITNKRVYHLDKKGANRGTYSVFNVDEVRSIHYRSSEKNNVNNPMMISGIIISIIGLIVMALTALYGTTALAIGIVLILAGIIILILAFFTKQDVVFVFECTNKKVEVALALINIDTAQKIRDAIFLSKDRLN